MLRLGIAKIVLLVILIFCLGGFFSNGYSQEQDPVLLLRAVQANQLDQVRKIIKEQPQLINQADDRGFTPLHIAAVNPDTAILELLLESGADIEARTDEKKTPLYLAAEFGRLKPVQKLLEGKAFSLPLDKGGNTPLMAAVANGQSETVKWMLKWMDEHGTMIDVTNTEGQTVLFTAVMQGDLEIVKLLIKNEANPKIVDKNGMTILHVACLAIKPEVVEYLLREKMFDIDIRNKNEATPLHMVASSRAPSRMQPVATSDGDKTKYELVLGDTKPQVAVIEMLVKAGADVNAKDKAGLTPLQRAVYVGNPEIVEALFSVGAKVSKEEKKWNALHLAASNGHLELVRLLLDKGMDVNGRDHLDITPLHGAAFNGHKKIVALLLEKGADVRAKDIKGKTPYDRAEAEGHTEILKMLVESGYQVPEVSEPEKIQDKEIK